MGEGLSHNVVTSAGRIKASKGFGFESRTLSLSLSLFPVLRSASDLNYRSFAMDVSVMGIVLWIEKAQSDDKCDERIMRKSCTNVSTFHESLVMVAQNTRCVDLNVLSNDKPLCPSLLQLLIYSY